MQGLRSVGLQVFADLADLIDVGIAAINDGADISAYGLGL